MCVIDIRSMHSDKRIFVRRETIFVTSELVAFECDMVVHALCLPLEYLVK